MVENGQVKNFPVNLIYALQAERELATGFKLIKGSTIPVDPFS